jgi:diadenosine tetraphosphate (Ap4A) HIT family hydrolase
MLDRDVIREAEHCFAIYDKYPVNPGHVLVISRRHVADYFDLEEGEVAGQTIDHVHIHVIQRYAGDMGNPTGGVRHVIPERGKY